MLKSYKTEINPTQEQKEIINKTIGVCRFLYNFYIIHNKQIYEKEKGFVSGIEFSKWLNNEFIPANPDYKWIKEVSSKSTKQSIMNADRAFRNFFKKKSEFPKLKKKNKSDVKMYFFGIGVDLGLKELAVCSNHGVYKNINKSDFIRKLEKKLKREQRRLSRKYEDLKKRSENLKGEATRQNIQKQKLKVQKIHQAIDNIRTDHINKTVNDLVKAKPSYITVEDLNVSGMMKNRHLSRAIARQKFFEFRVKLENKCKQNGIELRIADRFYPSSKICHKCGNIKADLKFSDRIYICGCGYEADRDLNAALNLRDAKTYKVA